MTKIEEAAAAVWHARAKHFGEPPRPLVKDERWDLCLSYARAAIEAVRRLTPEMRQAGEQAYREAARAEREMVAKIRAETGGLPSFEDSCLPAAWNAIIDAALTEESSSESSKTYSVSSI